MGNLFNRFRDFLRRHGDAVDVLRRLLRCGRGRVRLHLIVIGGLRHDLRAIVHRLRRAVERTDDVIHRMFEISGHRFDLLPPRFGLPCTIILALARGCEVFDRAAEYEQRLGHAPDLVVAADRDRNIRLARSDPAHGAAEQRQASDDTAADIEPGNRASTGKRNNAEEDQNDLAKLDL
jgi:hypothetical protein